MYDSPKIEEQLTRKKLFWIAFFNIFQSEIEILELYLRRVEYEHTYVSKKLKQSQKKRKFMNFEKLGEAENYETTHGIQNCNFVSIVKLIFNV